MPGTLLTVQFAATWFMVGLIWTVQRVHYPMLAGIDPAQYPRWQQIHMARISLLVVPVMLIELVTAGAGLWLAWRGADAVMTWGLGAGLVLLLAIWLETALVQAPLHGRLRAGADRTLLARLVRTNWVRTALWTLRGLLLLGLLLAR